MGVVLAVRPLFVSKNLKISYAQTKTCIFVTQLICTFLVEDCVDFRLRQKVKERGARNAETQEVPSLSDQQHDVLPGGGLTDTGEGK